MPAPVIDPAKPGGGELLPSHRRRTTLPNSRVGRARLSSAHPPTSTMFLPALPALGATAPLTAPPPILAITHQQWTDFNTTLGGTLRQGFPVARPCFANVGANVAGSMNMDQCSAVQSSYKNDVFIADNYGEFTQLTSFEPVLTTISSRCLPECRRRSRAVLGRGADRLRNTQSNWATCQATGDECLLDYNLPQNPLAYILKTCKQGSVSTYYVPSFLPARTPHSLTRLNQVDVAQPSDVQNTFVFAKAHGIPLAIKNSGVRPEAFAEHNSI